MGHHCRKVLLREFVSLLMSPPDRAISFSFGGLCFSDFLQQVMANILVTLILSVIMAIFLTCFLAAWGGEEEP